MSGATIYQKCLGDYLLNEAPPTIYYIPNFISYEEEDFLVKKVGTAPKPKWVQLSNRRLQNWGGLPHPKGMVAEPLPDWLQIYVKRVSVLGMFEPRSPNHVLVNEYLPGQGIMPHEDGPLFYPTITTINLGSHTVLDFYKHEEAPNNGLLSLADRYVMSLFLERCSLLIIQDEMYLKHLHGIKEGTSDLISSTVINKERCNLAIGDELKRQTRISLTIRHVPKTIIFTFKK